jgi:hypothetical protein
MRIEQPSSISMILPSLPALLSGKGTHVGPSAAVEFTVLLSFPFEGGLDGFPVRVSNEGLLRPRVARAQETV